MFYTYIYLTLNPRIFCQPTLIKIRLIILIKNKLLLLDLWINPEHFEFSPESEK